MSLAEAVGGGGRYDEMIGKFTGNEHLCMRIFYRIRAHHHAADGTWFPDSTESGTKKALLIEKNMPADGHDESSETGRRRPEKRYLLLRLRL